MSLRYNKKIGEKNCVVTNRRKVVFLVDKTSNVDVVYRLDQGLLRRMPARHLVRRPNVKHSLYRCANEHLGDRRGEGVEMGRSLLLLK